MAQAQPPAVVPMTVEWELRNGRTKVVRTFEQTELTIEGEARLVGLARKVSVALTETGYSFEQMGEVLSNEQETNWRLVLDVVTTLAEYAPDLVADLGTILLGIYPTDEMGQTNPPFEDDRRFLRASLNIRRVVEMLQTFMAQNDYQRIMAPFGMTLTSTMAALRGGRGSVDEEATEGPSFDGQIVGTDGSLIDLEPDATPPGPIPLTPATTGSASRTPSEPSPI